jgi:hypothetical protein
MNKTIVITVILVVAAGFLFWGSQTGFFSSIFTGPVTSEPLPAGIVLFFGADCPHCIKVEAFIQDNKIDSKIKITKLEIPFNGKTSPELVSNSGLLVKAAQTCKMDASNGVGIPLLYDGAGKCFNGDVGVIDFLKAKTGI